jgi:hypothetical protein
MTAILIAAAILFVIYRQFQTRDVSARGLIVIPLVLVALAAQNLATAPPAGALAIAALALDVAAGIVLGVLRGRSLRVWRDGDGTWWRTGTAATAALWIASIAVRIGIIVGARALGVADASAAGPLELAVGISLAAQYAVVALRCGLLSGAWAPRVASELK